jgi:hypothetical protein
VEIGIFTPRLCTNTLLSILCVAAVAVQAPVQKATGNVSAGFKGGFTQAKALLNKAAASVSEAATSVGAAAAAAATKGKNGSEK